MNNRKVTYIPFMSVPKRLLQIEIFSHANKEKQLSLYYDVILNECKSQQDSKTFFFEKTKSYIKTSFMTLNFYYHAAVQKM